MKTNEGPLETVSFDGQDFAIIIRRDFSQPGVHFFTPDSYSQQLAYMEHPAGKKIQPHFHNDVTRSITLTQEVLMIQSGILDVHFYCSQMRFLDKRRLYAGDVILLCNGGHGFEVIEEVKMIEVKQGPYCGDQDKTRFDPVTE